jgi:hypothetical protein
VAAAPAESRPFDALEPAFDAIAAELALISGDPQRVDAACAVLASGPAAWVLPTVVSRFQQLASAATHSPRALTARLASLLCEVAASSENPWAILSPLVSSGDPSVCRTSLECLRQLVAGGRLALGPALFEALGTAVHDGPDALRAPAALEDIRAVLDAAPPGGPSLLDVYLTSPHLPSRRLAARLLDLDSTLPSTGTVASLLGVELAALLEPYFAYTRATHLDLAEFAFGDRDRPALAEDLRSAAGLAGPALMREVFGELGWKAVNCGLTAAPVRLVSVWDSFPLLLEPAQARLLEGCPGVKCLGDRLVFTALGSDPQDEHAAQSDSTQVDRFRACNLRHADVLADLLDVAPLTPAKVTRLVARMDDIVSDFCALFEGHSDECGAIRALYGRLRGQIAQELAAATPNQPLSAELTRLVQMFEDPASASAIHTLHGCKRYLHQRGLRLGFKLAEAGRSTNRTVTIAVADREHMLGVVRAIEYVDFEASGAGPLPPLVRVGTDAYTRHLLHGERAFPKLKFFCYGNEVHCFATFRNHPAFIRVDFSPPQRGGMIDLEYCGVSKFDLDWHPNPSLTAIESVFRRLDFDIGIDNTRIRARYDKERASDLRQLSEKVEALFRLMPALMDVDWIIGDLQISAEARREVAMAWAAFFERWGILPVRHVLTADRLGVLTAVRADPAGDREVRWTGADPYRDRFSVPTPAGFWTSLAERLADQGIGHLAVIPTDGPVSQQLLESALFAPLRRAVDRGELTEIAGGYTAAPPSRYRAAHEARLLAEILGSSDAVVADAARMARLASMLEGSLRFDEVGTVNGYTVQRAAMSLPGRTAALCGLRDEGGILQAALFVDGDAAFERRDADEAPWRANWTPEPRRSGRSAAATMRRRGRIVGGCAKRSGRTRGGPS